MAKLLMISGYGATNLHAKGAFYNTLEEFHKHWERIDIICPRGAGSKEVKSYFGNVFVHESPWPIFLQPWFIARKGTELHQAHRFDLVTVHEYAPFYNGWGAYKLWKRIRVPYALEIMHIPGYPRAATLKERAYRFLTGFIVPRESHTAQGVRVINKHETSGFLIRSGVSEKKIFYAPAFYIDLATFRPVEMEKKYDCIFVGRLAANKGIDAFLDAVKLAGFRALIVGDGPLKNHIQAHLQVENLSDRVTMHGWASDAAEIASLMNQSRVLVMTSYNEGGPRVVLEAMACGVPVLATPVGIVPDIIQDGESGRIINWDSSDIAKKADSLLHDTLAYDRLQKNGLRIAQQFERVAAITAYANALKKLYDIPAEVSPTGSIAEHIQGYTSARSGELLYQLARRCTVGNVIVEIGSWKGRSTVRLALGSKDGPCVKVYAVDPHKGSAEHHRRYGEHVDTYDAFLTNIREAGVADIIEPARKTSVEFAHDFEKPVGLIFIDGDHSYEAVKDDFFTWFPKVVDGGIMAFDDSIGWDGPRRVVREYMYTSRHFRDVKFLGPITYGVKVRKNTFVDRCMNRCRLLMKDAVWLFLEGPLAGIKVPTVLRRLARTVVYSIQ